MGRNIRNIQLKQLSPSFSPPLKSPSYSRALHCNKTKKSIPSATSNKYRSNTDSSQDGATDPPPEEQCVYVKLTRRAGMFLKSSILLCLFAQLSQASQNRDLGTGPSRAHELGRQVWQTARKAEFGGEEEEEKSARGNQLSCQTQPNRHR